MLKNLVRITVLVAITAAAATSWVDGPSRTAEQVVRLASEGQFEELSELIVAPCALESMEDGGVRPFPSPVSSSPRSLMPCLMF